MYSAIRAGLAAALVVLAGLLAPSLAAAQPPPRPEVSGLLTNGLDDPLAVPAEAPRLSWRTEARGRGVRQVAYQVRVTSPGGAPVWDSGRVASAAQVDVSYGGRALSSFSAYEWAVRVWARAGGREAASPWSAPARFETGPLRAEEWTADWIGAPEAAAGWSDYTVRVTASDIDAALGIYFRGRDTANAYMWQISEAQGALRPHVKQNGGYRVLPATAFPAGFDFAARHTYAITVDGDTITTRVDGEVLDTRTDATHGAPGVIGFRVDGAERGVVHAVSVTDPEGDVLFRTDFPAGDRSFTAGTVGEGGLAVGPGGAEAWLSDGEAVPVLRREFAVADREVARARIYASAQGLYELHLNGAPVGDHELAPGWTDYRKRIAYQAYDVTDLVRAGANALGAQLADGWFAGRVAIFGDQVYGSRTALIAQLRIEYADGTVEVVGTDGAWRTTDGPITGADLLDGEAHDARRAAELAGWDAAGYDDAGWDPVAVRPSASDRLEPQTDPPVRVTQELGAERIPSPDPGVFLYDLGQNMVGRVRLTLAGEPGRTVRIRHGEELNADGSLYTANLRSAKATDHHTFAGTGPETFEPSFTFHGFRYVEITGVDEAPPASALKGMVLGTDGELVSALDTSSDLVDQLHSNITWGQRGNFLSIPTDTPARDERMGWTGDINVFARTAVYNMDSQAFLTKWLQDLRDTQRADGALPGVAPVIPGRFDGGYGAAGWADAGVHVPWTLWQAYGDTAVIRENYDMMRRYVDYLHADSTNHIRSAGGYLDWLNLDDPTPADVLDTAFVAKGTRELAQMAAAIGQTADAERYAARFEAIRAAFQAAFIAGDGTVKGDSQTAYILALTNDLVPADRRDAVADQFVETLERRDYHLSTGFLGVDGLLPALTAAGRTDLAYELLENEDYPSWGYEIGKGATTIWERWNSIMPDGSFGPVEMNSFNHYAYGAVGEWMYRTMAGVSALEPGYKRVLIAPQPGGGITSVRFSHETRYGTVATAWSVDGSRFTLDATVPVNTTAELRIPAKSRWAVTEGGRPAEEAEAVRFVRMDDDTAVYSLGSGEYAFAVDPVLGDLGEAEEAAASLRDRRAAASIGRHAARARNHRLRGRDRQATAEVHRALAELADLRGNTAALERHLSAASAALLGVSARVIVPEGDHVPGDVVRVEVVVDHGDRVEELASALTAPGGWTLERAGAHAYDVRIPADATPGTVSLTGTVAYGLGRGTASLPVSADLSVGPAVAIGSVAVTPAEAAPGATATLRAVVRNRTGAARTGALTVAVPDGWTAPAPVTYQLPAEGEATVEATVAVPLAITEGPATVAVATAGERAEATVRVAFANPPAGAVDHVDLGDAASERAHGLTASSASGTSPEAGLTRRYTNAGRPGGWFEADLRVPAGEPFVLRAVETFDGPQYKTYDVLLDGEVVHTRAFRRTATGTGSLSYQFVVQPSEATADGAVRLRFQDTGADHDPSIADVWATPLG